MDGEDLIFHDVLQIRAPRVPTKILREIRNRLAVLVATYNPDLLAVEKTFVGKNRRSAILNVVSEEIRSLAQETGVPLVEIPPSTARKFVAGNGWATKTDVAKAIVYSSGESGFRINSLTRAFRFTPIPNKLG